MSMTLGIGDILHCDNTGEQLLLLSRIQKKPYDREGDVDWAWDMVDIVTGDQYWQWEYVLQDSGIYKVIA